MITVGMWARSSLYALLEGQAPAGAAEALTVPAHGTYLVAVVPLGPDSEPRCAPGTELRRRGMPSSWHVDRGTQVGLVALANGCYEPEARRALGALLPGPAERLAGERLFAADLLDIHGTI